MKLVLPTWLHTVRRTQSAPSAAYTLPQGCLSTLDFELELPNVEIHSLEASSAVISATRAKKQRRIRARDRVMTLMNVF